MATKRKSKTWNDISGVMRVYGKEFGDRKGNYIVYSTSVYTKDENDDYHTFYIPVYFPKNDKPDETGVFSINLISGFISATTGETTKPKITVTEYEILENE